MSRLRALGTFAGGEGMGEGKELRVRATKPQITPSLTRQRPAAPQHAHVREPDLGVACTFSVRELCARLRRIGCEAVRTKGSHQTWKTPRGASFALVVNHPSANPSRVVMGHLRRVLRAEGLWSAVAGDEPLRTAG